MTERLTLTVSMDVNGDPGKMEALIREYLTEPEYPFLTDYGPEPWGGYEGPTVSNVNVERVLYTCDADNCPGDHPNPDNYCCLACRNGWHNDECCGRLGLPIKEEEMATPDEQRKVLDSLTNVIKETATQPGWEWMIGYVPEEKR